MPTPRMTLERYIKDTEKLCETMKLWQMHSGTLEELLRTGRIHQIHLHSECCIVITSGDGYEHGTVVSSGIRKKDAQAVMSARTSVLVLLEILEAIQHDIVTVHDDDGGVTYCMSRCVDEIAEDIINQKEQV